MNTLPTAQRNRLFRQSPNASAGEHGIDTGTHPFIAAFIRTTREHLGLNGNRPATAERSSSLVDNPVRKEMNHYRTLGTVLLATGLGMAAATPALADRDRGCDAMYDHGARHEQHMKMREQHQQRLHEALKLSAAQEPAWKKLMDTEPKARPGMMPPEEWSKLTTPERAEKMLEFSRERNERMSEHVSALKSFYAQLTPEQKKTFEEMHASQRGAMRGKMMKPQNPGGEKPSPKP
ncbi:MAG TPA: Spy/CpxP family protein refolding chaperone [Accumulibacter sp.]|nr:Spy/CpxP family protein refolding chaperone [Accumulibacter sp.]HQC79428.1 Spy/CpxP family protein refolding chaperone [Accumulibacter sp.]